jgi:hypothetical protein
VPSSATRALVGLLAAFGLAACIASPSTARVCLDANGLEYDCVAIVGRLVEFEDDQAFVIPSADYFATTRAGEAIAGGLTDGGGVFVADGLPTRTDVALAFLKSEYAPAVFTGETAERDSFLFVGSVHQDTVDVVQEFVDEHSAAVLGTGSLMTVGSGGGAIVRGRVRRVVDPATLEFEDVGDATVEVLDGSGNSYPVYYRNVSEEVDATATGTNDTDARFAAFAVTATNASAVFGRDIGQITVRVTIDGNTAEETTFVIDGGITEFDRFSPP